MVQGVEERDGLKDSASPDSSVDALSMVLAERVREGSEAEARRGVVSKPLLQIAIIKSFCSGFWQGVEVMSDGESSETFRV